MGQFTLFVLALVSGSVFTLLIHIGLRKKALYTRLIIDDIVDHLQQVNLEVLQLTISWIIGKSLSVPLCGEDSYVYRRELRLVLELVREYTERMLHNSALIRYVADADQMQVRQRKLEYSRESLAGIYEIQEAQKQFRRDARLTLFKIWLWSLTGFANRTRGSVPDLRSLPVAKMLHSYNRVKCAVEAYALLFGEAGTLVAAEIRLKM